MKIHETHNYYYILINHAVVCLIDINGHISIVVEHLLLALDLLLLKY